MAKLLARLDGKAERWRVSELEANDRMGDPRRAPVVDGEINTGDLREPHGARVPVRRVVGRGTIVAVAHVMKSELVAVNVRPRQLRHIGLPVAIVARFECEPPAKHEAEGDKDGAELAPEWPNEYQRSH